VPQQVPGRLGPLPLAIPGPDGATVARNADASAQDPADAGGELEAAPGDAEATSDGEPADATSETADSPVAEAAAADSGEALPPTPVLVDNGVFGEPVPVGALLVQQMPDALVTYYVDYPWPAVAQAYSDRYRGKSVMLGWHREMDPPYFGVMDPNDVLPHGMIRIEASEDGRGTTIAVFADP
jgi:hypothetical protein